MTSLDFFRRWRFFPIFFRWNETFIMKVAVVAVWFRKKSPLGDLTKCCVGQHPLFFTLDLHIVFIALSLPKTKALTHFWLIWAVQRYCLLAESWFCLFVTNSIRRWNVLKWCRREADTISAAKIRMHQLHPLIMSE